MRGLQAVAYTVAVLIGPAVNNPRKMPRFDRAFPDRRRQRKRQAPEAIMANMKAWTVYMQAVLPPAPPEDPREGMPE